MKRGRCTFSHTQGDAARYAGEILLHFLKQRGVSCSGVIKAGTVGSGGSLVYAHQSRFRLEEALEKMLEFSNNFMANQILVSLGAWRYGPPGTLAKGVKVVSRFVEKTLGLAEVNIVEGSGISRKNRLSVLDMRTVLERFRPYRHILKRKGDTLLKTGSLRGITTRAGYIERDPGRPYYVVLFLNRRAPEIESLITCLARTLSASGAGAGGVSPRS